jgi:hypothetical protein
MNVLRSLLFENLGVKLVALLLALVVYLHVYTERTQSMTQTFVVEFTDVPESLAVVSSAPPLVSATVRGTGKQLIRLRLREPRVRVSLAGAVAGPFQREITIADLPLSSPDEGRVEELASPRVLHVQLDRMIERDVPVAARINGREPAGGWTGAWKAEPPVVRVRGPRHVIAALDSLPLEPVHHDAGRTLTTTTAVDSIPLGSTVSPVRVELTIEPVR